MPNTKTLSAAEDNRLAIELQIIKIKTIECALQYSFNGESHLWGNVIRQSDLSKAKNDLELLYRKKSIYESQEYKQKHLPYFNSPGSIVDKIKTHFNNHGTIEFIEVKRTTTGDAVVTHLKTKSSIKKQIKKKQMATKKKAVKKKAAPKKAAKKAASKTQGESIKSVVYALVDKDKTNEQIFAELDKKDFVYSINSVRWYASKARAGE